MQQPVQIPQLTHLTNIIVNSMAQQRRVVRRRVHLTSIVPEPPLHTIVATHLLNQQVRGIVVLSLETNMLEVVNILFRV